MASIIEGYNYDIFISYRQKDNKHDGWVTEFVNNLKDELESAFKEEISVYFDINPHDGLLETHDVDASLKEKLKCLIFIPIISRTYCDPKSFAWEHEFKAFIEMSSKDQFGLKVKLPNGNVAGRVLPVRIHELDIPDIISCESLIGGELRGIDFIYRSTGVNRPLRFNEDHPNDNLYKTYYRDQINKVANAVREIILGLTNTENWQGKIHQKDDVLQPKLRIGKSLKLASLIFLALATFGVFIVTKLVKPSAKIETSIAVLPFTNDSQSDSASFLIIGIEDAIRNNLQSIKSFSRVLPRTSTEHFRGSVIPSFDKIARELNVNYLVEGGALKFGKEFQLTVKLSRVHPESQLWSKPYKKEINSTADYFKIESEIAQAIAGQLDAVITPAEDQLIRKTPTNDMEALNAYLKGEFYRKNPSRDNIEIAKEYYGIALNKDPGFAAVYCSMAMLYSAEVGLGYVSTSEGAVKQYEAIMKAMKLDSTLAEVHLGLATHYCYQWNWKAYEAEILKSFSINPNIASSHATYSDFLIRKGRLKEGIEQMDLALKLDPVDPEIKSSYCYVLTILHRYPEAVNVGREVLKSDPQNVLIKGCLAQALYLNANYDEALSVWKSLYSIMYPDFDHAFDKGYEKSGFSGSLNLEADTLAAQSKTLNVNPGDIAMLYAAAGNKEKALNFWELAFNEHDINMILITDPVNDFLSDEPRYQYLCRQMGMPVN